uniref:Uncharacterized protein n=1 Tax=Rhizophora mucronata TaxID=61149 RepID=A0A2P2ML65_RHIMU
MANLKKTFVKQPEIVNCLSKARKAAKLSQ